MGFLARTAFPLGWMPDADASNGPSQSLLRMDNCVLDELGVVAQRKGSAPINAVAFTEVDCHSLFTATLNGTRYRMLGAGNSVIVNSTFLFAGGVTGTGDISFGSHLGQILMARGSTKRKYDGATARNWGINPPSGTPTITGVIADSKVFADCNVGSIPAFTQEEGTITATFPTGADGTANGALEVTPSSTTGRAVVTKTYVAETDFTVLSGGGLATDDHLISFYVYLTDPSTLLSVTLEFDCNGTPTNRFQEDYFAFKWNANEDVPIGGDREPRNGLGRDFGPGQTPPSPTDVDRANAALFSGTNDNPVVRFQPTAGWNKLQITRGQMTRIGSTVNKGWNTIKAVRVIAEMTGGGTNAVVRFDDIKISGGPLTGAYRWLGVLVYNSGTYQGLSGPGTASNETTVSGQSADVTFPGDGARDLQATELWLYRAGGSLDTYYRTATVAIAGFGAVTVRDTLSDRDALLQNLKLEVDNTVPPNNIIGIAGPYYDRTAVLTSDGFVAFSRRLNPDSFSAGQVIRATGPDETPYWIKQAFNGLYIGTSKDVYRISGTGAELPDDSLDFVKEPLNIDHPPISPAVAQDGNLLVYLAADGWRVMNGAGSKAITGPTSLLYKGYTRHGVSPVNLSGRVRATIAKGQLVAITPEGSSTTLSTVLYRYVFALDRWYRHVYPVNWRSVAMEPDGTLIAGDFTGQVWTLDTGTLDHTTAIPIALRTIAETNGQPFSDKQAANLQLLADTDGVAVSVDVLTNESDTATVQSTVTQDGLGVESISLTSCPVFRSLQLRISGSPTAFKFAGFNVTYQGLPLGLRAWDSGPMDLGVNELIWIREIRIKVKASADLTATITMDGRVYPAVTIPIETVGVPTILDVPVPKGCKGTVPRVVITSTATFYPYYVEFQRRTTGAKQDKPVIQVPANVGGEAAA